MKEFASKILSKLHIIILLYTAYAAYGYYEDYQARLLVTSEQIPSLEKDIVGLKKRLEAIDTYKKNIESSKKSVEEVFKNIEKVQRQLPAEVNDIDILDHIAKEGRQLNIPELTSTPLNQVTEGFSITKPFRVKGKGTFLQLVVFLERLSRTDRIFNIQKVDLIAPLTAQKGRFQVIDMDGIIETYKYNQGYKESNGIDEINSRFGTDQAGAPGEPGVKPKRKRRPKVEAKADD